MTRAIGGEPYRVTRTLHARQMLESGEIEVHDAAVVPLARVDPYHLGRNWSTGGLKYQSLPDRGVDLLSDGRAQHNIGDERRRVTTGEPTTRTELVSIQGCRPQTVGRILLALVLDSGFNNLLDAAHAGRRTRDIQCSLAEHGCAKIRVDFHLIVEAPVNLIEVRCRRLPSRKEGEAGGHGQ